ncbi:MAG: alpha/beta hydrolase [Nitrososphaeraceae archaeon]|nr:alpha/beta hydrolase [Nitrososphaeraceae archaeon]
MRSAYSGCCINYVIIVALSIFLIGISTHQITYAQQQQPTANFTSTEQQLLSDGISFQIDNVTFTHHTASVNGIQLHYVMGGKGDPILLLHGYPQSWYEWRYVMPDLAKNHIVIAADLRGFGDSSKPMTGYDGKTIAEDINQLMTQLGFNKIFLVAHDVGSQPAFSFTAEHLNNVTKLVIMDFPYPGFLPAAFGQNGPWWFSFYQTRDIPEVLIQGHEREYLSWFMKGLAYNPDAITDKDIDVWTSHIVAPGGLRGSLEHFRAFPIDAEQNKETAKSKITTPVLALGGDIYPALGGDYPGNFAFSSLQSLATNVKGVTVPLSGHWIPEEQPKFVVEQLLKFFGEK